MTPTRLCFVCLGNICRSPTAAAVMRHLVAREGLQDAVHVESAGTAGWHVGAPADPRSAAELARRGVPLEHRARRFAAADFDRFDLILAMDAQNLADLRALAPGPAAAGRVRLLREFDPDADGDRAVPDPYYGGADGFATVFDMVEAACRGLMEHLRA